MPVVPRANVLRLQLLDLDPTAFEEFVFALVREEHPDTVHLGANDRGVDVLVPSQAWGIQCKRFERAINWRQCEESLDQAAASHPSLTRYAFAMPLNPSAAQQQTFERRLRNRHPQLPAELMTLSDLRTRLTLHSRWARLLGSGLGVAVATSELAPAVCPWFRGRDTLLEEIHERFEHGASVQVLTGLQGSGKTQVAAAYVARHGPRHDHHWWMTATSPTDVLAGAHAIAADLGLAQELRADDVVVRHVAEVLAETPSWLLAIDDARPETVAPLAAALSAGRVLVTSLDPDWRGLGLLATELPSLAAADARAVLADRSGRRDEPGLDELVEELGRLPLALEQVGAYLEEQPALSVGAYLTQFRERAGELLARGRLLHYSDPLAVVWSLSRERACEIEPASARLLAMLAHVHHRRFPLEVLERAPAERREPLHDDVVRSAAIGALRRYSLLSFDRADGTLSVHRLVQTVVRHQLAPAERSAAAAAIGDLLWDAVPEIQEAVESQPQMQRLANHAIVTAEHLSGDGPTGANLAASLLGAVGGFERSRGRLRSALVLFAVAVELTERLADTRRPTVQALLAQRLNNLAAAFNEIGELDTVAELQARSLALREKLFGPDDPRTILAVSNLAGTLSYLGRTAEALPLAEHAWTARNRLPVTDDRRGWGAYVLAEVLHALGRHDDSLPYADEAVEVFSQPDARPRDRAWALELRATVRLAADDIAGAREDADEALALRQRVGEEHLDTARAWSVSGRVAVAERRPRDAIRQLRRAQHLRAEEMAPDHPDVTADATLLSRLTAGESDATAPAAT